ncbi:hypothetical protein N0V85_003757 [Neurospora sp. IMI 360204]|nr:hypothetical protein N0V85_003757 [Neurospora sp. IMI 360204]
MGMKTRPQNDQAVTIKKQIAVLRRFDKKVESLSQRATRRSRNIVLGAGQHSKAEKHASTQDNHPPPPKKSEEQVMVVLSQLSGLEVWEEPSDFTLCNIPTQLSTTTLDIRRQRNLNAFTAPPFTVD